MKIRGRILARKTVIKDPPSVVPLKPAAQLKPERHEKSQERCVCVCVSFISLSQLSCDRAVEPAKSLLQLPVRKVPLRFLDGRTC